MLPPRSHPSYGATPSASPPHPNLAAPGSNTPTQLPSRRRLQLGVPWGRRVTPTLALADLHRGPRGTLAGSGLPGTGHSCRNRLATCLSHPGASSLCVLPRPRRRALSPGPAGAERGWGPAGGRPMADRPVLGSPWRPARQPRCRPCSSIRCSWKQSPPLSRFESGMDVFPVLSILI